jgi:hypothetical protein
VDHQDQVPAQGTNFLVPFSSFIFSPDKEQQQAQLLTHAGQPVPFSIRSLVTRKEAQLTRAG